MLHKKTTQFAPVLPSSAGQQYTSQPGHSAWHTLEELPSHREHEGAAHCTKQFTCRGNQARNPFAPGWDDGHVGGRSANELCKRAVAIVAPGGRHLCSVQHSGWAGVGSHRLQCWKLRRHGQQPLS